MNNNQEANLKEALNIGLKQIEVFFSILQSLEQKAGIFVGFISIIIAEVIRVLLSRDIVFNCFESVILFFGVGLLFASMVTFVLVLQSKTYRIDPNIHAVILTHGNKSSLDFNKQLVVNFNDAIENNTEILNAKAKLFRLGTWFLLGFIVLFVIVGASRLISNNTNFEKGGKYTMTDEYIKPVEMPAVDTSISRNVEKGLFSNDTKIFSASGINTPSSNYGKIQGTNGQIHNK